MLKRLVQLRHSRFVHSTATLTGGQLIATAISFAMAPVLSRLYTPADYGVLATYMSLAVILSAVANLQMSRAVVAEADERRAHALLGLSLWLAGIASALTLLPIVLLELSGLVSDSALGWWLVLLPATILASGTGSALLAWANRHHNYRLMSRYQIFNVVFASGTSLLFGWFGFGPRGLMIGYFLGQLVAFLVVLLGTRADLPSLRSLTKPEMLAAGKAHRNYALWSTPTAMIEQVSAASPILVLSLWGNMLDVVGHYNRARSLLILPVGILGGAIGQVFFRRAAQDMANHGHCRPLFWKLVLGMTAISLPSFAILALIAPQLFAFVLGPNWSGAGHIARILAPAMALQLIILPTSKILWIYDRQRQDFFLSLSFAILTTAAVAMVAILDFSPDVAIFAFTAAQVLMYLSYLAYSILIVERHHRLTLAQTATAMPKS